QFTQADLANFSRGSGTTVNLTGRLSGNFTLNDTLGAWNLKGGTLYNGTFSIQSGSLSSTQLFVTGTEGNLDAEILSSPVNLVTKDSGNNSPRLAVVDGLTLNTTLNLGSADTSV